MKKVLIVDDQKGWQEHHKKNVLEILPDANVFLANSAKEAYDLLFYENNIPFDIIITDMQMESDYAPKYAGEWLIEQIRTFKLLDTTKIIIVSATYNINLIAESYNVDYIRKSTALNFPDAYCILKDKN